MSSGSWYQSLSPDGYVNAIALFQVAKLRFGGLQPYPIHRKGEPSRIFVREQKPHRDD